MKLNFWNKNKRYKNWFIGASLCGTLFLFVRATNNDTYFEISKNLEIYATLLKTLNTFYVDGIEPGKLVKTGVDAMLEELDPYTNYITEADIEDYEFQTTGKYGGIGANMHKKEDKIFVGDVYEGSPAQLSGIKPGDEILTIDNQNLNGKSLDDIGVLLKGSPGTSVKIKIKDIFSGAESVKNVTRAEIEVSSLPYAGLIGTQKNIIYVKLTQFTPGCARLMRHAIDSLTKVQPDLKGFVLDLRSNPGGLLDEAVAIVNFFVDKGQLVVSTRGKLKELDKEYKTPGDAWNKDIPITVLVNHQSASASEIVAGTLQDLDRGVIIGQRSFGKGLVQNVQPLGYNARLKVTIAKYYTPSGRCIQALDYTHRGKDGKVYYVPDSLKKTFLTLNGRKVLSGGGVEPDVKMQPDTVSLFSYSLYNRNYLFDYASQYVHSHPSIAPVDAFVLNDADYKDFEKWLDDKDCSYKTIAEVMLDSLKEEVAREKVWDISKNEYEALQNKLSHNKKSDLVKHKAEISQLIAEEIVSRYYFAKGKVAQAMKNDADLNRALALLQSTAEYKALLSPHK